MTLLGQQRQPNPAPVQILHRACYLMPTSLKGILESRQSYLMQGMQSVALTSVPTPGQKAQWEAEIPRRMAAITLSLKGQPNFSRLARDFGVVAQMTIGLSLPEVDGFTSEDLKFFMDYMAQHGASFPLVLYDHPAAGTAASPLQQILEEIRQRRSQLGRRLEAAYPKPLASYPTEEFDERSALYGMASLMHSHAAVDIARIWLSAWKEVEGDMAGSPLQ